MNLFHFRHYKQMRWPTLICIFCEHMEQICKTALSTLKREWWWYTVTYFKLFYWKITKWDSVEVSWINTEHVFEKIAFKVYKHCGTMYNIKKHIKMDNTLQKCPPNCPPTHDTIIKSLQFIETNTYKYMMFNKFTVHQWMISASKSHQADSHYHGGHVP